MSGGHGEHHGGDHGGHSKSGGNDGVAGVASEMFSRAFNWEVFSESPAGKEIAQGPMKLTGAAAELFDQIASAGTSKPSGGGHSGGDGHGH